MKTNKKPNIEQKMLISKVDETYCVLRYNIWQVEHTSKTILKHVDRITIRHSLCGSGIGKYNLN